MKLSSNEIACENILKPYRLPFAKHHVVVTFEDMMSDVGETEGTKVGLKVFDVNLLESSIKNFHFITLRLPRLK